MLCLFLATKSLEEGIDDELHTASKKFSTWLQQARDEQLACSDASGDGKVLEENLKVGCERSFSLKI